MEDKSKHEADLIWVLRDPELLRMRFTYHIDTFSTFERTVMMGALGMFGSPVRTVAEMAEDLESDMPTVVKVLRRTCGRLRHPSRKTPMETKREEGS